MEVEPSLYAADFAQPRRAGRDAAARGGRIFHFDVGDGHFVPPVTIGPVVLRSIAPLVHRSRGAIDCHLMVDDPVHHFAQIAEAGRRQRHVPLRAVADVPATVAAARELELQVGVAFNPETAVEDAAAVAGRRRPRALHEHPSRLLGPGVHARGGRARGRCARSLPDGVHVQVDGGIGPENVRRRLRRRRDLLVAGRAIFAGRAGGVSAPGTVAVVSLERALELAERGRGRPTRTRSSARSSSARARWWGRGGTSARAARTGGGRARAGRGAGAWRDALRDDGAVRAPRDDAAVHDAVARRRGRAGGRRVARPEPRGGRARGARRAGVAIELDDLLAARARTRHGARGSRAAGRS